MQVIDTSGHVSESTFHILRTLVLFAVFMGAVVVSRWGIRKFILGRGRTPHRNSKFYSIVFVVLIASLLLLRSPIERLAADIRSAISASHTSEALSWLVTAFLGFYYVLILSSIFLIVIQGIGFAHRFVDKRIEVWQVRLRDSSKTGESNPRFHASKIVRMVNRLSCNALVFAILLLYFGIGFSIFPRTEVITGTLREFFGPPLEDAVRAVENYLSKLGYLLVILMFGWVLLRAMKYVFGAIKRVIVLEHFPSDWVDPTYKLCQTALFLFVLMVSFPYLPGAESPFFRGFSLFLGALVTLGSGGTIGNLLAGILADVYTSFSGG